MRHPRSVLKRVLNCVIMVQELRAPYELVKYVAENGRLPVVNFAAGGVATPADAALMMQLGMIAFLFADASVRCDLSFCTG